jgi:hypothetical protein
VYLTTRLSVSVPRYTVLHSGSNSSVCSQGVITASDFGKPCFVIPSDCRYFCLVNVKLPLCIIKHHVTKTYREWREAASRVMNLGTRWRWVVSFEPPDALTPGNEPPVPIDMRLGGPHSLYGGCREEKSLPCRKPTPGSLVVQHIASHHIDRAIWASVFLMAKSKPNGLA